MLLQIVKKRLDAVEERIAAACQRAGRQRSEVTMVAVTKTVPIEVAACLPELGVFDLAENRPQELWRKAPDLPKTVRWHMIGHLQRNKIERTLPLVHMIHSVDSLRLLEALDAEGRDDCEPRGRVRWNRFPCLSHRVLEVEDLVEGAERQKEDDQQIAKRQGDREAQGHKLLPSRSRR